MCFVSCSHCSSFGSHFCFWLSAVSLCLEISTSSPRSSHGFWSYMIFSSQEHVVINLVLQPLTSLVKFLRNNLIIQLGLEVGSGDRKSHVRNMWVRTQPFKGSDGCAVIWRLSEKGVFAEKAPQVHQMQSYIGRMAWCWWNWDNQAVRRQYLSLEKGGSKNG